MATHLHKPDAEKQLTVAAPPSSLWGKLRARGVGYVNTARTALSEQRDHAKARTGAWLTTADLDDADLERLADEANRRKRTQHMEAAEREAAQLHARLRTARSMQDADGNNSYSGTISALAGRIAVAETRLEAMRNQPDLPPTRNDLNKARLTRKASRVGAVLLGGYGYLQGVAVEPGLLLLSIPAAGFGWWVLSRPLKAEEGEGVPFPPTPPQSLPPLWAPQGGGAPTGGYVVMSAEQLPEGVKPFPMRQAQTPEQLAQCVLLAARAESVPIVEVSDVKRQPWGWQCVVRVDEGTPEAIVAKAGDLETRFDLPTNGVRPQPIKTRRACAVLRLVDGDPFLAAPGLPYRAPKSMSITDKFRVGTSVGGDPLELSLAGVMGLWVAASGGGKTGILQALGEGTTACYDNITIDLDPFGDGLEDLGDAVRITARSNQQIEAVLLFFLIMAKGRARLRAKLGMGKKWQASAERPAVTIFFDELPKGSSLAKRLYNDLLLVGRKELIVEEAAAQGGQSSYLGGNIAQMVALKAVGPCKVEDTRSVFGDGSVREGYLPHKLSPATATDPKDAGHIYIQGVPGMADEPIEYAIHEVPSATLRMLAAERLEAGLLDPDQESLDAMKDVDLPEYVLPAYDNEGNLKKAAPVELLTWEELLKLCGARPSERMPLTDGAPRQAVEDAVTVMGHADVDRMKTEVLLRALHAHDHAAYAELSVDGLKALLKEAGAGAPITLGQIGDEANPRGFKRDRLRQLL